MQLHSSMLLQPTASRQRAIHATRAQPIGARSMGPPARTTPWHRRSCRSGTRATARAASQLPVHSEQSPRRTTSRLVSLLSADSCLSRASASVDGYASRSRRGCAICATAPKASTCTPPVWQIISVNSSAAMCCASCFDTWSGWWLHSHSRLQLDIRWPVLTIAAKGFNLDMCGAVWGRLKWDHPVRCLLGWHVQLQYHMSSVNLVSPSAWLKGWGHTKSSDIMTASSALRVSAAGARAASKPLMPAGLWISTSSATTTACSSSLRAPPHLYVHEHVQLCTMIASPVGAALFWPRRRVRTWCSTSVMHELARLNSHVDSTYPIRCSTRRRAATTASWATVTTISSHFVSCRSRKLRCASMAASGRILHAHVNAPAQRAAPRKHPSQPLKETVSPHLSCWRWCSTSVSTSEIERADVSKQTWELQHRLQQPHCRCTG